MNKPKLWIGIDVGLSGAIASLRRVSGKYIISVRSTPVYSIRVRKPVKRKSNKTKKAKPVYKTKSYFDATEMVRALRESSVGYLPRDVVVAIEAVSSSPQQGVTSAYRFGHGAGLWAGLAIASGFNVHFIRPQVWKPVMVGKGDDNKKKALAVARKLWPQADLAKAKDDGKAEALLIAEYIRTHRDTHISKRIEGALADASVYEMPFIPPTD